MPVRRRLHTQSAMALLALVAATLAGCSGKSASVSATHVSPTSAASASAVDNATEADSATDTGSGSVSPPSAAANQPAMKTSDVRMRVVNLYAPKSDSGGSVSPGPALDVYDVQLTGQAATPVATNVAYGSASPYFATAEPTNDIGNPVIELYALPAGEDPTTKQADAKGIGGAIDDGSHAQITWLLTADNSGLSLGGALGRLSFSDRVEKGDDGNGAKAPVAPAPTAGKGEILVDTAAVADKSFLLYLLIGSSCTPPINGDSNDKTLPEIFNGAIGGINTSYSIFPTTPGSHQVSVVENSGGVQPKCAQLTAKQGTTTVDVAAGQQVEAYVYGTSATDLHLAFAPIAP